MNNSKIAQRARDISPFHVMDILAKAQRFEQEGRDIIHMEVGEPDFDTPQPIIDAGIDALKKGKTHYTPALGLPELRQAVAEWYQSYYNVTISANRVVITPGASGALLLMMGALVEKESTILLADPGYPCNLNFARFIEANAISIPVDTASNYQLTARDIEQYWCDNTALALIASPSNPTGTLLSEKALLDISQAVIAKQGKLVVDEIYHGLTYDGMKAKTVLAVNPDAYVINSFSKFFGMTGWRLGWLIVPEHDVATMDRLAQNLYLAAPTVSQYAALAAFKPETQVILEQRRVMFEQRRDALLPALEKLGFDFSVIPQGAFYLYANCEKLLSERFPDSMALSRYLLEDAGVAITPGLDFGANHPERYCRFAYTNDVKRLLEAVDRIAMSLERAKLAANTLV